MKLSNNDKKQLRLEVATKLQSVPDGQRIHLDKDVLEDLLFDELVCKKETGETVKLPIWSGEFLRKIDLSEVSFDNVSWSLRVTQDFDIDVFDCWNFDSAFCKLLFEKCKIGFDENIDYSYTNANIDFSKSWEAKHGKIEIWFCNFSGVDLSNNNNIKNVVDIYYCDLSNTKLKLSVDNFGKVEQPIATCSNFSNIDLGEIEVNAIELCCAYKNKIFDTCNLSNTGIKIILNVEELSKFDFKSPQKDGSIITVNQYKSEISQMIKSGYLDGCYINGKYFKSKEERQSTANEIREEYEKMKDSIFDSIAGSIDEQVGSIKK